MSAFYDPNPEKHPKILRPQFGQIYDVKKSAHTWTGFSFFYTTHTAAFVDCLSVRFLLLLPYHLEKKQYH